MGLSSKLNDFFAKQDCNGHTYRLRKISMAWILYLPGRIAITCKKACKALPRPALQKLDTVVSTRRARTFGIPGGIFASGFFFVGTKWFFPREYLREGFRVVPVISLIK